MGNIRLETGTFGWDYRIVNEETNADILIQTDWDYPSVASTFGWGGYTGDAGHDIRAAQDYIDENIGEVVEDPGYFS